MQIDIKKLTQTSEYVGQIFWICDIRQPDLTKKPIRHVKAQPAMLRSNSDLPKNKRLYYSENHFVKLNAKGSPTSTVIPIYDNTGYRSFTGTAINVFDNKEECLKFYNEQIDTIVKDIEAYISSFTDSLNGQKNNLIAEKTKII